MHFWYNVGVLEQFIDGPYKVRSLNTSTFTISKDTLPASTEIIVLKVLREGDL
jgi:hypothetical protein